MKKTGRVVSLLMSLVLCVGMLSAFSVSAAEMKAGDFIFEYNYRNELCVKDYTGSEQHVVLPSKYDGKAVVGVLRDAVGGSGVKELTIPASIKWIEEMAFSTCWALETVHVQGVIEDVHANAFHEQSLRRNPDNLDECGNLYAGNILIWAEGIDGVSHVREGTATVATEAMYSRRKNVREIYFPASLRFVCEYAFAGVKSIEKVVFSEGERLSIANAAFSTCSALKEITLTANTCHVGSSAFGNTAFIQNKKNFKNGILYCGPVVLDVELKASQLEVELREGTTLLAYGAFQGIQKTPYRLIMPDTVRWIDPWCFAKSNVAQIVFSKNLESIGAYAFHQCRRLLSVELPEGIKTIPERAFFECGDLRTVELPASLKKIEKYAFKSTFLVLVKYHGTEAQFNKITIRTGNTQLKEAGRVYDYVDDCPHPEGQNYTALRPTATKAARISRMCVYCGKAYDLFTTNKAVKVETVFKDVATKDWFYAAVDFAYNYNAFKGTSDTAFSPNQKMTRGMFVTVLMRLSGNQYDNKQRTPFFDVPVGQYYTGAVRWAAKAGIVNGTGNGLFEPDATITREQLCKMIVGYTYYSGTNIYNGQKAYYFADDAAISDWARDYVYICQATGLVSGKNNNVFDPQAYATRAEVATILYRLHEKYYYLNI